MQKFEGNKWKSLEKYVDNCPISKDKWSFWGQTIVFQSFEH